VNKNIFEKVLCFSFKNFIKIKDLVSLFFSFVLFFLINKIISYLFDIHLIQEEFRSKDIPISANNIEELDLRKNHFQEGGSDGGSSGRTHIGSLTKTMVRRMEEEEERSSKNSIFMEN